METTEDILKEKVFKSLITIAKQDIESAKILYDQGSYFNSLFLFQQAVEKGYKAYSLITRQLSLRDLKKVGHDYMKLLKKVVADGLSGANHPIDPIVYKIAADDVELDSEDLHSTLGETSRSFFFALTDADIDLFLGMIDTHKNRYPQLFQTALGNEQFMAQVEAYTNAHPEDAKLQTNELLSVPTEELTDVFMMFNHVFTLNILGLLTSPHSEQTRYPSYNVGETSFTCPTDIYNQSLPLIKNQKKLMLMAQESIDFFNS